MNNYDSNSGGGGAYPLSSGDESLLISPPRTPSKTFENDNSNEFNVKMMHPPPLSDDNDSFDDNDTDNQQHQQQQQQLNDTLDSNYGWQHVQDLLESDNSNSASDWSSSKRRNGGRRNNNDTSR